MHYVAMIKNDPRYNQVFRYNYDMFKQTMAKFSKYPLCNYRQNIKDHKTALWQKTNSIQILSHSNYCRQVLSNSKREIILTDIVAFNQNLLAYAVLKNSRLQPPNKLPRETTAQEIP